MTIATRSYEWYHGAAQRSRRAHRITEIGVIAGSAAIPVAAVLAPHTPAITAVLGAVLVVATGVRASFKWQENYLRFSQARSAVEQQRRLYRVGAPPYDDPATRDEELVRTISLIEGDELAEWVTTAGRRTDVERTAEG